MERINEIAEELYEKFKDMDSGKLRPFIAKILQRQNGKKLLSLIEDKAIAMSNFEFMRKLSYVDGVDIEKINKAILATKDACLIYEYCEFRDDIDIQPFEDALIELNDAYYIYMFARFVKKGKNIEKLQQAICKTGDSHYLFEFAKEVKMADRKMLADAYLNSQSIYLCDLCFNCEESINSGIAGKFSEFIKFANFKDVDVSKFVDYALKLKDKEKGIYAFEYRTGARVWPFITVFFATDEQKFIEQKAENCKQNECDWAKLNEKQKNALLTNLYFGLAQIKGISQEKLSDLFNALVELGCLRTVMTFLPKATKENVENLQAAVIATGDAKLIAEFAAKADDIDMQFMAKTLADTQDGYSIYCLASFLKYKDFSINLNELESVYIDRREDFKISEEEKQNALKILTEGILTSKDQKYIQKYVENIVDGDISRFEDEVIKRGDVQAILEFAKIKGANVKRLQDALIKFDTPYEIIEFAKIKGADIKKLEDRIIEIDDAKCMFEFAKKIKKANVKRLKEAILQTDHYNKDSYIKELDNLFKSNNINEIIDGIDSVDVGD